MKDLTTVKLGKATTVQDRPGKCLTEERETLGCAQTDTENDHPILRKEVGAAVQSLKKGKSAGVDNIPAELVQADGEDVITALTTICNKIWQTGEWPTPWTQSLVITTTERSAPSVTQGKSC